jgi:hypothetical protein
VKLRCFRREATTAVSFSYCSDGPQWVGGCAFLGIKRRGLGSELRTSPPSISLIVIGECSKKLSAIISLINDTMM